MFPWDGEPAVTRSRQVSTGKKERTEQYILFREMQARLAMMGNMLGSRLAAVTNPGIYEGVKAVVEELSSSGQLKKPKQTGPGKYVYPDLRTDEAIVSMAFYLAAFEDRRVGIATADYDLRKILIEAYKYWEFVETAEGISGIAAALYRKPAVLMLYRSGYDSVISTSEIRHLRYEYKMYNDPVKDGLFRERALAISRRAGGRMAERAA